MDTFATQLPPAAMVAFENEMEPALATGAKVGEPQPEVEAFGVAATVMAPGVVGSVSENATPLKASFGLGLTSVNVSVVVPPARIGSAANCLLMAGACSTVRVAAAVPPAPLLVPDSVEAT